MKFKTPWSADPDSWKKFVSATSRPGVEGECIAPSRGIPPVVQRFHDLFLFPHGPLDIPALPPETTILMMGHIAKEGQQPSRSYLAHPPQLTLISRPRNWSVTKPIWGIHVSYEQAWFWQGSSLGELIESISLAPNETLEIQVYTWERTKVSRDLESTDLVDQKSETSLTMHDSSQIIKRMEKERHWEFGANVGFSSGVTAGVNVGFGGSTSDLMERRREQKQEFTSKTSQQVRSERKIKISTVSEVGTEKRRKRILKNMNPTRTVTYNFYETLSHYQVEIAPVEAIWVVAIPNKLPQITPEWVTCHEGILREHLLDPTQEAGFEVARKLTEKYPTDIIFTAIGYLYDAFRDRNRSISIEREERRNLSPLDIVFGIISGGAAFIPYAIDMLSQEVSNDPNERYSDEFIESFLRGAVATPTLGGLLVSMKLVVDRHKPWRVGSETRCYSITRELESAVGYAYAAIVQALGDISKLESDSTEEEPGAARNSHWELRQEHKLKLEELVQNLATFQSLACHIEENLLHYMRPIWLSEDPAQRWARIARELFAGTEEERILGMLIQEPLLGFHLNCSVYPVRMGPELEEALREALKSETWSGSGEMPDAEGPTEFSHAGILAAKELQSGVKVYFESLAKERFKKAGRKILDESVQKAVSHILTCKETSSENVLEEMPSTEFKPEMIQEILKRAETEACKVTPLNYLSKEEVQLRTEIEDPLSDWATMKLDKKMLDSNLQVVWVAGRRIDNIVKQRDLKPIMVSLPDGGYHCEPVVGRCSAADDFRTREIEAETAVLEAKAKQEQLEAERRERCLAAGNLDSPTG
ncbi:MAG: hypothetical protein IMF20_01845 [Proteobacteria bacterium]|nr:hypothetical protein [Pseudomonadota bacterium]